MDTGISISAEAEWDSILSIFNKTHEDCNEYPLGEYFFAELNGREVIIYFTREGKVSSSAATQYMIDTFHLKEIIVAGTCAGVNESYRLKDIVIPYKVAQYDCTVNEIRPLIKKRYVVELEAPEINKEFRAGFLASADKALVMWDDYLTCMDNGIDACDMEAGAVAYICKLNNVRINIIKGISDFPTDERKSSKRRSSDRQAKEFEENVPLIMEKIFKEYIGEFL